MAALVRLSRVHPVPIRESEAVFSSFKIPKILQDFLSHRIFGRMPEVLNICKKNN
jgi:hypothetical protein